MKILLAAVVAAGLAVSPAAYAADDKKAATSAKAEMKLVKPASVKQEAWDKMTDAEKKKAVEAAKAAAPKKKEKKGGC